LLADHELCILRTRDVVQLQDFKILFQLPDMEQIRSQLRVIAAAFALDLLDDEMRVTLHK
jgi:hypothetical protein